MHETGRVVGTAGSFKVAAPGVDPGVGFYRFVSQDIPGLDFATGRLGNVVEIFAVSLADAQKRLGFLVAKKHRGATPAPVLIDPTHHRATSLGKRHRKAIDALGR